MEQNVHRIFSIYFKKSSSYRSHTDKEAKGLYHLPECTQLGKEGYKLKSYSGALIPDQVGQ